MGYLSFSERYYRERLESFEKSNPTPNDIYEAKQLLKLIDDLVDEGYTELYQRLENGFSCVSRLRAFINNNRATPFEIKKSIATENADYFDKEYEIVDFIDRIMISEKMPNELSNNPFLKDIFDFCEWIGYNNDTAYIFLLRDTLLPYVYYKSRGRENLYPFVIGRSFLSDMANKENVDDEIRLPIYEALENGCVFYDEFKDFCAGKILKVLKGYPALHNALDHLLKSIKHDKIMVIESGYTGTIPMMICALDERSDFRMYTTAPYLYQTYNEKIYCKRYEDIRNFETLFSQDLFIKYSSFGDGKFYVKTAADREIKNNSLKEIFRGIQ